MQNISKELAQEKDYCEGKGSNCRDKGKFRVRNLLYYDTIKESSFFFLAARA